MARKNSSKGWQNQLKWGLVVALLSAFVVLLVWALYQREQIMENRPILLIEAPQTPVKERPEQPGGLSFPHQERAVFDLLQGGQQTATEPMIEAPAAPISAKLVQKSASTSKPVSQPANKAKTVAESQLYQLPKAVSPTTRTISGEWGVQLASFINRRDAERAVLTYLERHSEHLTGLSPDIQTAEVNGAPRYRVRFVGLQAREAARTLCATLTAAGQGCLNVRR